MKAVLFCKNNGIQTWRNLCAAFKACQGFASFDENEQQSLYQASVSSECDAVLPLNVHLFTPYQITVLLKASMAIPDSRKENKSGLSSVPINSGIPHRAHLGSGCPFCLFSVRQG